MPTVAHLALALFFVLSIPHFGRAETFHVFYMQLAPLIYERRKISFWILVFPAVFWPLSIVLYKLNFGYLISGIWVTVLFYWIITTLKIGFLGRWSLLSWKIYSIVVGSSLFLTWLFVKYFYSKGLSAILPDSEFGAQLLLLAVSFIATWFQDIPDESADERKRIYILRRVEDFRKKFASMYRTILQPGQYNYLLSVMVYEDYQRPTPVRWVEYLFKGKWLGKTRGVTQEHDVDSDVESVMKTANRIASVENHDDFLVFLIEKNGTKYKEEVLDVYNRI